MMQEYIGNLKKMNAVLNAPIEYRLQFEKEEIILNNWLGKKINLEFLGEINCVQCGRKTNKSFEQGHCYPCFLRLQECNCILHPERCRVEEGNCSKEDWAHRQCDQEHIIYLANSSGLKVGITRSTQIPHRWIDQGAVQGLPILRVKNRRHAGMIEVGLKQFVSDRTNWREMLKGNAQPLDLTLTRDQLLDQARTVLETLAPVLNYESINDEASINLQYPITEFPKKITTFSLDKQPTVSGILWGIKGQYLILDTGVINLRKFSGYRVRFWV